MVRIKKKTVRKAGKSGLNRFVDFHGMIIADIKTSRREARKRMKGDLK